MVTRKQVVRYLVDGKQVVKGTKGATVKRDESRNFYGTLKLANGRSKQVALCEERKASEDLLRLMQTKENEKRATGILHDYEPQAVVDDLLASFLGYLTDKGSSAIHAEMTQYRLRKLFKATKTRALADLDAPRITATLALWRKQGRAVSTTNGYLIAAKSFLVGPSLNANNPKIPSSPFVA